MHGKVALVTGGGSGIGAGIARVLAADGAQVAVADLNEDAAAAVATDLSGLGVHLDVTDRSSTDAAVSRVEAELGPVDVLVNNAGISSVAPFLEITDPDWDRLLNVNLRGVLVVTQRVLPSMLERRSGRIINILRRGLATRFSPDLVDRIQSIVLIYYRVPLVGKTACGPGWVGGATQAMRLRAKQLNLTRGAAALCWFLAANLPSRCPARLDCSARGSTDRFW